MKKTFLSLSIIVAAFVGLIGTTPSALADTTVSTPAPVIGGLGPATLTVSGTTDSSITVSWTNVQPDSLSRDGVDASGVGPWSTGSVVTPTGVLLQPQFGLDGSFTFLNLLPGTSYDLYLTYAAPAHLYNLGVTDTTLAAPPPTTITTTIAPPAPPLTAPAPIVPTPVTTVAPVITPAPSPTVQRSYWGSVQNRSALYQARSNG